MRQICSASLVIVIILHLHLYFLIDCLSLQFIFIATLCTIPVVCMSFIVSALSCSLHCVLRTSYWCCQF